MILCELSQYIIANQEDEVAYFFAPRGIFITEGIEDDTAIYVHIFAQGVVKQSVFGINNR